MTGFSMQSVPFQLFPAAAVDGLRACVCVGYCRLWQGGERPAHAPIDCSTLSVREETLREASSTHPPHRCTVLDALGLFII